MGRLLFNILATLSLLLCLLSLTAWTHNRLVHEQWSHQSANERAGDRVILTHTLLRTEFNSLTVARHVFTLNRDQWANFTRQGSPVIGWSHTSSRPGKVTSRSFGRFDGGISTRDLGDGATEWTCGLMIPCWFLVTVTIPLPLLRTWIALRRRRHLQRHWRRLCPTCGYDLRASPDQCPECGRTTSSTPS